MRGKIFKGSISISRCQGGSEGARINITINDELSGTEFFDGMISAEDFGNLVTGLSYQPIEFEFRPKNVGLIHEHKQEVIKRPEGCDRKKGEKELDQILIPYEVDGWKAHRDDAFNHHRWVDKDQVRVSFHRFVEQKD